MSDTAARGYRATVALLLLLSLTVGCAARTRTPSASPVRRDPHPTAEALLTEMRARETELASFRGQATLDYKGPDGSSKSSQMIVVQAPDHVRIDFMSPFGPTYTVATDGRYLRAYDRGDKVLYVGVPTATNVQRYARVPLTATVLAQLIRGLPPFLERATNPRLSGPNFEADLEGGGRLRIELAPDTLYPRRAHLLATSLGENVAVELDRYEDVDGIPVAHRVHAQLPDGGTVELEYSQVWRAVKLTDTAFQIDAPGGVRVVGMDAEGKGGKKR